MSRTGKRSCWAISAFLVFLCAIALFCAAYATNYWEQTETSEKSTAISIGLWRYQDCSGGYDVTCTDYTYNAVPSTYKTSAFVATQALASIVLVMLVVILVLFLIYLIAARCRESVVATGLLCTCIFAVILSIICMIVWLAQIPSLFYPGYSFGMFVISFILVLLSGLLLIPDIRSYGRNREITRVNPNRYDEHRHSDKDEIMRRRYDRYDERYGREPRDYAEVRRERYNRDVGREDKDIKNSKGADDVHHYYNPNRKPLVRSPPPRYSSAAMPETKRDVYLGTPTQRPHRF